MAEIRPKIHESWLEPLDEAFQEPSFKQLKLFLKQEKEAGKVIFPPGKLIFNAFDLCPFETVKVVLLGQDPYHGKGQAHGLCFSVLEGVPFPPSLHNIFQELEKDLGFTPPAHGNLDHWARQGVLLLNTCLTVREGQAGSHFGKGWETFTDHVIRILSDKKDHLVFILWGRPAQEKKSLIDTNKHDIIESPHPSPLSAHRGFFKSFPFSRTNQLLNIHDQDPINWNLSPV